MSSSSPADDNNNSSSSSSSEEEEEEEEEEVEVDNDKTIWICPKPSTEEELKKAVQALKRNLNLPRSPKPKMPKFKASTSSKGESSAKCLANVLHRYVHLCVLSISHNPDIGDQAAANIVTSLVQRKVSSAGQNMMNALKLCCVSASRKTAKAVAEMLTKSEFSSIRDLDLRNNRIDCIGASAIASSLSSLRSSSRLRVRLDTNLIEDRGAASLLSALKFRPKILQITLSQNETSPMLRSSFAIASNRSSAFYGTAPPSFVLPGI